MKKHLLSVISVASLLCTGAFAQYNFDRTSPNLPNINNKNNIQPVNTTVKEDAVKPKEWTIMVYMNAKNNMEEVAYQDINEMEAVGSTDKVNMVIELGRARGVHGDWNGEGDWVGTRRYLIHKDNDPKKMTSPVVEDIGTTDMGDYKNAINFINWAKAKYPAKKYMFMFWNHGSGWTRMGADSLTRGISYDDETGNHIKTIDMGLIFAQTGKIDVVGSDACLMQMVSVNYEMKDNVSYIFASEEVEPFDGNDYTRILTKANKGTPTPRQMSKNAVDSYAEYYDIKQVSYAQSAVKASAMNGLKTKIDKYTAAVMKNAAKREVKMAIFKTVKFEEGDNKDLYDFVENLNQITSSEEIKKAGADLQKYITQELVAHNRTNDFPSVWGKTEYNKTKGIAVYLPNHIYNSRYENLKWAKESSWPKFIKWYLDK